MHPEKRRALVLVTLSLAFAVVTPLYIAFALPMSAVYHRSWYVVGLQVLPYVVYAAIWLPARNPAALRQAYRLAMLLFVVACVLYLPQLARPRSSGDMVGLWYLLVSGVTTIAVVALSAIALVVVAVRRRLGGAHVTDA